MWFDSLMFKTSDFRPSSRYLWKLGPAVKLPSKISWSLLTWHCYLHHLDVSLHHSANVNVYVWCVVRMCFMKRHSLTQKYPESTQRISNEFTKRSRSTFVFLFEITFGYVPGRTDAYLVRVRLHVWRARALEATSYLTIWGLSFSWFVSFIFQVLELWFQYLYTDLVVCLLPPLVNIRTLLCDIEIKFRLISKYFN